MHVGLTMAAVVGLSTLHAQQLTSKGVTEMLSQHRHNIGTDVLKCPPNRNQFTYYHKTNPYNCVWSLFPLGLRTVWGHSAPHAAANPDTEYFSITQLKTFWCVCFHSTKPKGMALNRPAALIVAWRQHLGLWAFLALDTTGQIFICQSINQSLFV